MGAEKQQRREQQKADMYAKVEAKRTEDFKRNYAALKLQSRYRGRKARERTESLRKHKGKMNERVRKKQEQEALIAERARQEEVEKQQRREQQKADMYAKVEAKRINDFKCNFAATKLQSRYRGRKARERTESLRKHKGKMNERMRKKQEQEALIAERARQEEVDKQQRREQQKPDMYG